MKYVVLVLNKMISRTSFYCRFVRHSQSPWQKQNNFFSRNLNKKNMSDQYQMERLDHQNEFILTIKNKHNPKDKLSLKKRNRL